jgi:ankyrin repeat protein
MQANGMDQFMAAQKGKLQVLHQILTRSNVSDAKSGSCSTALHCAAYHGKSDCVKYCLEMGANVDVCDGIGSTGLHVATMNNSHDVRILLGAGALVDVADNFGMTPLRYAVNNNGRIKIARLLLDHRAKVENVMLPVDEFVSLIPDWVNAFIVARSMCRCVCVVIIGIQSTIEPT